MINGWKEKKIKEKIIENDFKLNVIKTRKWYSKARKKERKKGTKIAEDNNEVRLTVSYATVCTTFLR